MDAHTMGTLAMVLLLGTGALVLGMVALYVERTARRHVAARTARTYRARR